MGFLSSSSSSSSSFLDDNSKLYDGNDWCAGCGITTNNTLLSIECHPSSTSKK
jgi:hypothetical protein